MRFALCCLLALGCSGGSDDDKDSGTDSGEVDTDDGVSPQVLSGTIECGAGTQGDEVIFFTIAATVDDPQGADTVKALGWVGAYANNGEQEVYSGQVVACGPSGECAGSFKESDAGLSCTQMGDFVWRVWVEDEDGNTATPFDLEQV